MENEMRIAARGLESGAAFEKLHSHSIEMSNCPKFTVCYAPTCPLDTQWRKRKHLKEDRVCFYLLEATKTGAEAIFRGAGLGNLYQTISQASSAIRSTYFHIDRACNRANQSGSRMARRIGGNHV